MNFSRFAPLALIAGLLFLTTSCATMHPADFAKSPQHLEVDRFFIGHCLSWGVFENSEGNPLYSFVCNSYGKRDADGFVILHQEFTYTHKKPQTRDWRIKRIDSTHWDATASDMVGTAHGEGIGNAFYWEYNIALDKKNPLATVHVRQWMYQPVGTNTIMTRLVISKLGVIVSEVSEEIHHK